MKYSLQEIQTLYNLPFPILLQKAHEVHQQHQKVGYVQLCAALSIKTGSCPEDCAFCPQSAHYNTFVKPEKLLEPEEVIPKAEKAQQEGATQFCLGAAWRKIPKGPSFEMLLDIVSGVKALGLNVCCSLGSVSCDQARALKEAGCSEFNHNLDTSREYYKKIITTRPYEERLQSIANIRKAGLRVSCGGILGMGETIEDRLKLLMEINHFDPHPEAMPINALQAVKGTPLGHLPFIDSFEFVRIIALARILMPKALVSLAAGRPQMSCEMQALCFSAGANSFYFGEKILTTDAGDRGESLKLLQSLGLKTFDPEQAKALHAA